MNYTPYLPADCQGDNRSFPWNQKDTEGEPQSLGSDCCKADIKEEDGVIKCLSCNEACEEVFESEEQLQDRVQDEVQWAEADRLQDRFESEREERFC